jgi:glucose-1-phosphate cytidylyltransferase
MKVVILAGGLGTRLSEETDLRPKPMVEIGGKPILWHIMKIYSHYGFNDFVICLGYKGYMIKEYFANYCMHQSSFTIDFSKNAIDFHQSTVEPWTVSLVDTGIDSMTGGRIKRIEKFIDDDKFMLTYGDGVADVNLNNLLDLHEKKKKIGTLTAVHIDNRFGVIGLKDNKIYNFAEKNPNDGGWINGGFMVFEKDIFDYIDGDSTIFEKEPLEKLSLEGNLNAYKHKGFWQCMDTQRENILLNELWNKNQAGWKLWP